MARELWDAYDREGNPLGFDLVRGEPVPEGVYHLVVEIFAVTADGRVLITQRHPDKAWGGRWEYTGGAVVKGETADYELLPYEDFKRVLREDRFVDVVRVRFLDHQEAFDRIITEHFK